MTLNETKANKTDAGNGSKAICCVSNVLRSPSPDPRRKPRKMSAFDDDKFHEIYPVSFIMRNAISAFWFRMHSLPDSKRYPEDETEWGILFERHRALTDEVLVEGGLCRVHYTLFSDTGFPADLAALFGSRKSVSSSPSIMMLLPSLKTMGLAIITVALFVAIMPFQMPSPGVDLSTRLYRESKGSVIPAAQAHSDAAAFFIIAAVLAGIGVSMLVISAARDWRSRRSRKTK